MGKSIEQIAIANMPAPAIGARVIRVTMGAAIRIKDAIRSKKSAVWTSLVRVFSGPKPM